MPVIFIDNVPYEVKEGQNLLVACLSLGFNLPYFCWHPALNSIGACRLCAVKQFHDEKDTRGRIVMSCMTPASEGARISINDPEAVNFRKSVIEWLMVNHPHDCPVCDEGGECHLQDMTLLTGHVYRRYRFKKRTYRNQYLGPFINHEMNRCIQCYRCVRFYRDYAGGRDLDVFGWHDHVYFGRKEDGILQSEFAGNLVEVCPTGVFTDKTFKRHYTRKWDLQTSPSICVHCSLGCNTIPGERYGTLRRIRNRYNRQVNGYFLCDRGRFGYEFVNAPQRIRQPLFRKSGSEAAALSTADILRDLKPLFQNGSRMVGIGSARASIEANFALRNLVGPENFYAGMSDAEFGTTSAILDVLRRGSVPSASLYDLECADAVLILGEDLPDTAPRAALAVRQSVLQKPLAIARRMKIDEWHDMAVREAIQTDFGPLFIAACSTTRIDDIATETYRVAPDDIARLGFAVAHELDNEAPSVDGIAPAALALAQRVAETLKNSERPVIVSGTGCLSIPIIEAAASIAHSLLSLNDKTRIFLVTSSCNSFGPLLLGGKPMTNVLKDAEGGLIDTAVIVENDLFRTLGAEFAGRFLHAVGRVITIDSINTATVEQSDVLLPSAAFAESDGTFINNEGRAQRFFKAKTPPPDVQESWRWLSAFLSYDDSESQDWDSLDAVLAAVAAQVPALRRIIEVAPPAAYRLAGEVIPRQPHRYSGRTAMFANVDVNEKEPPCDTDSPFAFSMEGYQNRPPSPLINRFWAPHWNSVQAVNKFQSEINGPLIGGDPGIRLFEPRAGEKAVYAKDIPSPFRFSEGKALVVPAHHVFGSEELSNHAPGIIELAPEPYVALNQEDAARLGARSGDVLEVHLSGEKYKLLVRIDSSLPKGLAAVPTGHANIRWDGVPFLCEWDQMRRIPVDVSDG